MNNKTRYEIVCPYSHFFFFFFIFFFFCSLVHEVHEIAGSVDALMQRLNDAEHALKDLQDDRMALEKEISIKTNSLFIDKDKCMTHRTRYPTAIKLQGYQ